MSDVDYALIGELLRHFYLIILLNMTENSFVRAEDDYVPKNILITGGAGFMLVLLIIKYFSKLL